MLTEPQSIPVGQEPPPMHRAPSPNGDGWQPARHQGQANKAKEKPERRKTADRFAVLNAFIDFTMGTLTRNEIAVWLVLYRDTRSGTARTGQTDTARRAGISAGSVRRAIERLREKGFASGDVPRRNWPGAWTYRIHPLPPTALGHSFCRL